MDYLNSPLSKWKTEKGDEFMPWTVQPFNKLRYSVNGGTAYQWNGLQMPIRYEDATDVIYSHGYQIYKYVEQARRGTNPDKYQAMYNMLDDGNGLDFWYYIAKVLTNGQEIEIFREDDLNKNIALIIQRLDSSQIRLGTRIYGTYSWLPVGNEVVYFSPAWGEDPPEGRSLISPPTMNIGFCTNGTKYNLYITQQAGTWGNEQYYDDNVYWLNCLQNTNFMSSCIAMLLAANVPIPPSSDEPYGGDDYNQSIGGDGEHDDSSDIISQSAIPIAAATRSGMCTAWVPNWGEIQAVANALIDPNIFQILEQTVVKLSDVIIALSVFPCSIPAQDEGTVKANLLGIDIGTGVRCHIADDQYLEFDCGSLTIDEYWGNCLDYNPYTRISIFLPFCGMYELDTDEVMGRTMNVSYRIDIFSGACLATIKIDGSVFYQYSGQCSSQVPLSSVSFDSFLSSMLDIGIATATGVGAVGTAGAAVRSAEHALSESNTMENIEDLNQAKQKFHAVKERSGNSIADAAVGAVIGSKGFYQHAGAISGSPGFLGVRYPYIIIKRPEQVIPRMYGKYHGFPANTSAILGDLVGYTEVNDIRLNIPDATVDEIIECEQLLKGGVVI